MQTTLLIIAAVLLLGWLLIRRRRPTRRQEAPQRASVAKKRSLLRAVTIRAPRLPLPDCDAAECRCLFVHHDDRRSGKDRRSPFAPAGLAGGTGSFQKERRERSDRRKDADLF